MSLLNVPRTLSMTSSDRTAASQSEYPSTTVADILEVITLKLDLVRTRCCGQSPQSTYLSLAILTSCLTGIRGYAGRQRQLAELLTFCTDYFEDCHPVEHILSLRSSCLAGWMFAGFYPTVTLLFPSSCASFTQPVFRLHKG